MVYQPTPPQKANDRLARKLQPRSIMLAARHGLRPRAIAASSHWRRHELRWASTAQVVSPAPTASASAPAAAKTSDTPAELISFQETKTIFKHKTSAELARAYGVFRICQLPWLVKRSEQLVKMAYVFPGEKFTNKLLRSTFFGHFCAGEDANEIRPVIDSLSHAGIGAILDYAAEADVAEPRDLSGVDHNLLQARTYEYEDESTCDANAAIARQAIIDAGATKAPGAPAFAAIKCTALGKPELLMRMSSIIVQANLLFRTLDGPNLSRAKSRFLDTLVDYPTLSAGLRNAGLEMEEKEIKRLFDEMDKSSGDGVIDYVDWVSFLDPFDLTMGPLTQFIQEQPLDDREKSQLRNMIHRLEALAAEAAEHGVKLMVDAEQTYMQPGIDHLVLNLQRKYNRDNQDVIYNTFQCYLKISSDRVDIDLERARRENFRFACKLVRGAYMVQERKRARDMGYPDPIHDSMEDTHANYDAQVKKLLGSNSIASFMVASHNEDSVKNTVKLMNDMNIDRQQGGVYFGQLLGMCDHVSYTLGSERYRVFKYVPYGPIGEVLPYLIRRAQENSGLMSGASKEMTLLRKEITRRLTQDTNSLFVAQFMHRRGIDLVRIVVIPDELETIASTVKELSDTVGPDGYVITTGGIGPTHDDITYEGVAKAFGVGVAIHQPTLDGLQAYMAKRNPSHVVNDDRKRMAILPVGCKVLQTATWVPIAVMKNVYVLPGIPFMVKDMLTYNEDHFQGVPIHRAIVHTMGFEGDIAAGLSAVQKKYSNVAIGSYVNLTHHKGEGKGDSSYNTRLTVDGRDRDEVEKVAAELVGVVDGFRITEQS
ncbi:TPA: hypothetical protein N0F65_010908 [Lagenidium giganteum]|uniref:proline dehydrogenase n=1 Tax=Lagenidium giganteum TaxID=4803 RepID=A0AAV2YVD6_9STRA|nr:TPA: hypothetical protein N0F65_010908 [Lagenidium giganteum]